MTPEPLPWAETGEIASFAEMLPPEAVPPALPARIPGTPETGLDVGVGAGVEVAAGSGSLTIGRPLKSDTCTTALEHASKLVAIRSKENLATCFKTYPLYLRF